MFPDHEAPRAAMLVVIPKHLIFEHDRHDLDEDALCFSKLGSRLMLTGKSLQRLKRATGILLLYYI